MHVDRYEKNWLIMSAVMLGVFFAAIVVGAVVYGVRVPTPFEGSEAVIPSSLYNGFPDGQQVGLYLTGETEDGRPHYDAYILAQRWRFLTGNNEVDAGNHPVMRIPVDSEVTFIVASVDITHGFLIEQHNVNFMLVPGEIARTTVTLDRPGAYAILCHEYCGQQHQDMWIQLYVETDEDIAARAAAAETEDSTDSEAEATAESDGGN